MRDAKGLNMLTDPSVATLLRSATLLALDGDLEGNKGSADANIIDTTTEMVSDEDAFGKKSDEWYKELLAAKQDIKNFTTQDILRSRVNAGPFLSAGAYYMVTTMPSIKDLGLTKKDVVIKFIADASNFATEEGLCWIWALTEGVNNSQLVVLSPNEPVDVGADTHPMDATVGELLTGKLGGQQSIWPIPMEENETVGFAKISVGDWTAAIFDISSNVTEEVLFPFLNVFFAANPAAANHCVAPGNCGIASAGHPAVLNSTENAKGLLMKGDSASDGGSGKAQPAKADTRAGAD
jgi:hypothetical protein